MDKKTVKQKSIEIIKIIAFVLAFLILLEGSSLMFFSDKQVAGFKNKLQYAYSFAYEPESSIQIACVGNSDLYSGFTPIDLWKEFGYTSAVCASARQSIQESLNLLKRLFKTQSPQIVIIETDMLYDENPEKDNSMTRTDELYDFFESMKPEYFERDIENVFPLFKFHNIWKKFEGTAKKPTFNSHGYRYNNKTCKLKSREYMKSTASAEPISKMNSKQMDKLIAFCQKNNAKVILVEMPSVTSWNYERYNAVAEYARERNVPFLDLNLLYDDIGISMTDCFRDRGNHLNYRGAKAVTEYIGDYISQNYELECLHFDKNYSYWNDDYDNFINALKYHKTKKK